MGSFSTLIHEAPESPTPQNVETYLGGKVQALRTAKSAIVLKMLGIKSVSRPALASCDVMNNDSILSYIAQENLECAFFCEPETPIERVRELCRIIKTDLLPEEYPHITLHLEYSDAQIALTPARDLLAYFQVNLHKSPQDKIAFASYIQEFKQQFINSNPL